MKQKFYRFTINFFKFNFFIILFIFAFSTSFGQKITKSWEQDLSSSVEQFVNCQMPSQDCFKFIGASVKNIYQINDFYSTQLDRYMLPNEIADFVTTNKQWQLLGHAYDKDALAAAQDHANANKATVAIYKSENGQGHVAIILPGDLQASGSWGIKVPNTASFFLNEPEKSYVNKGLSYAFKKNLIKDVLIYGRSYN